MAVNVEGNKNLKLSVGVEYNLSPTIEKAIRERRQQDEVVLKQIVREIHDKEDIHDVVIVENQDIEIKQTGVMYKSVEFDHWSKGVYFLLLKLANEIEGGYEFVGEDIAEGSGVIIRYTKEEDTKVKRKDREGNIKEGIVKRPVAKIMVVEDFWNNFLGEELSHDFTSEVRHKVLRCHMSKVHPNLLSLTIRIAPKEIPKYEKLNLPQGLDNAVSHGTRGLVLISGAVSSGKTTTANSVIDKINTNSKERKLIITAEEPIEYTHNDLNAKIVQRGVGKETPSFAQAARDALRETADIVYLGEVRTWEDMSNALQLSETGHLVITTIHSNGVLDTVERFVMSAPPEIQENVRARFNENLLGVSHQELIKVGTKRYPLVTQFFITNNETRKEFRNIKSRDDLERAFEKDDVFDFRQTLEGAFQSIESRLTKDDDIQELALLKSNMVDIEDDGSYY